MNMKQIMVNLIDYGLTPDLVSENLTGIPARVTSVHKERFGLISRYGDGFGRLKSSVYLNIEAQTEAFPTVGDFIMIEYNPSGDSRIIKTLPRKTFFSRRDPTPGRGEQAVAANFDYVFIMQSLNHDFNLKRLERYLTAAWQSGAVPVVVLTKADLAEKITEKIRTAEKIAAGVGVYAVSAVTGQGMDALDEYLKKSKTIVFLGSSGVGKSSLVNFFAGENAMLVNSIRDDDSKGRHTTTHRQLLMLESGAMVIDTPGMREFGVWGVVEGLNEMFADVEEYLGNCKFSDCRHESEPGCAVKTAIASGELTPERWESYQNLMRDNTFSDNKNAYLMQKWARNKKISIHIRKEKKTGKIKY